MKLEPRENKADALVEWEKMYEEAKERLGEGQRHTVRAISKIVRLRIDLEDNLDRAFELVNIGIKHAQDEGWKRVKLEEPLQELHNRGFPREEDTDGAASKRSNPREDCSQPKKKQKTK